MTATNPHDREEADTMARRQYEIRTDLGTVVVMTQCGECLAYDGGHEELCHRREWTVPPSPAWGVADLRRVRAGGTL
jgi:hypothetical protein